MSYLQRKALLVTFGALAKSYSHASEAVRNKKVAERSRSIELEKEKASALDNKQNSNLSTYTVLKLFLSEKIKAAPSHTKKRS